MLTAIAGTYRYSRYSPLQLVLTATADTHRYGWYTQLQLVLTDTAGTQRYSYCSPLQLVPTGADGCTLRAVWTKVQLSNSWNLVNYILVLHEPAVRFDHCAITDEVLDTSSAGQCDEVPAYYMTAWRGTSPLYDSMV